MQLYRDDLISEGSVDAAIILSLARQLVDMFESPPAILSAPLPATAFEFLREVTSRVEPSFIILYNIYTAFHDDNAMGDEKLSERFHTFCSEVLLQWLLLPNICFLILGTTPFLRDIESRPTQIENLEFHFEHQSLELLQSAEIVKIMEKTPVSEDCEATIQDQYELNEVQMQQVAEHLYADTCGHPQSLVKAFRQCTSYEELVKYRQQHVVLGYRRALHPAEHIQEECVEVCVCE